MRIGEDVCAVLPLMGNGNTGYRDENLPDANCSRRPDYVMCALTERTILM